MDHTEERVRLVGDYILGPKIGSGSFAVVWLSKHQVHGYEVAIKEIDKKHLSRKVHDSLLKEIDILRNIRHPNIIQFHEDIQTADKIFLVLEFCTGGDLAAYIQRFGRVSEAVARHFMRQLASGLQVLRENNLIHRDLKPQNLLLSTNDEFPILKIGDFGFARYLMPQRLADTLCGSPLYMAPEIIQNQKYDAKADLWSVGAILFQLVTGKPPFDGNSQFQLFQNILTSSELQFPQSIMKELHPDCIDLCKCLLRQNPVERLTFEEFFNHKFMAELRPAVRAKFTSPLVESRTLVEGEGSRDDKLPFASDDRPQLHLESSSYSSNPRLIACPKLNPADDNPRKSADGDPSISLNLSTMKNESVDRGLFSISTLKVADSLESIEQEYVLVNANFASMETLSSSLEVSMQDHSAARFPSWPPKKIGKGIAVSVQSGELAVTSVCGVESLGSHASAPLAASQASTESGDVQKTSSLHPSTRLRLLHQYGHALSELAEEKLNAGLNLESFSVELVALAVWREALRACILWGASATVECLPSSSANECPPDQEIASLSLNSAQGLDFNRPSSVCLWAEQGFLVAFDQAEKISCYLRDMDGSAEMPDAMEIIFQTALAAGKSGGVDELMGNRSSAATSYSKAMVLLSFILEEATSLPLNPPFSLTVSDQQRIHKYIINLKAHLSQSQSPDPSSIT